MTTFPTANRQICLFFLCVSFDFDLKAHRRALQDAGGLGGAEGQMLAKKPLREGEQ